MPPCLYERRSCLHERPPYLHETPLCLHEWPPCLFTKGLLLFTKGPLVCTKCLVVFAGGPLVFTKCLLVFAKAPPCVCEMCCCLHVGSHKPPCWGNSYVFGRAQKCQFGKWWWWFFFLASFHSSVDPRVQCTVVLYRKIEIAKQLRTLGQMVVLIVEWCFF